MPTVINQCGFPANCMPIVIWFHMKLTQYDLVFLHSTNYDENLFTTHTLNLYYLHSSVLYLFKLLTTIGGFVYCGFFAKKLATEAIITLKIHVMHVLSRYTNHFYSRSHQTIISICSKNVDNTNNGLVIFSLWNHFDGNCLLSFFLSKQPFLKIQLKFLFI